MINDLKLSIIIPCYNELEKLPFNLNSVSNFLKIHDILNYELIVVNDGSKDFSDEIYLEKLKGVIPDLVYISYPLNKGKGGAVREGISRATGDWVLFMDADLSTSLKSIIPVLDNASSYDVIIGSRRHKDSNIINPQSLLRRLVGKCCSVLTNLIIPLNISDTQCGFKAFNSNFAKKMIEKQRLNNFSFDVEYLYMSKLNNQNILEIGVEWFNDSDSRVPVLKTSINFFKDLFKIRFNKKCYKFDK